jgi:hypothetical protein
MQEKKKSFHQKALSSVAQLVARSAVMTSRSKQPEGFWFDPRLRSFFFYFSTDVMSPLFFCNRRGHIKIIVPFHCCFAVLG